MKFLLVLLVVAVGFFVWRAGRRDKTEERVQPPPQTKAVQDMVACAHCGLHLPRPEALAGQRGAYCSDDHLQRAGDRRA